MTYGARIAARGAILAVALATGAAAASTGLSILLHSSQPVLAAQVSPGNAEFATAAAARLAGGDFGTREPAVRKLVASALARTVAEPAAIELRALEADADGDHRRAARLFTLSDAISRRSLPTRLWLIQSAVDRGDVRSALANFDIALRTSTDAPATLFPVLATAANDPLLRVPLAGLLDRSSDWRAPFFHFAVTRADSVAGLASVAAAMRDRAWLAGNHVDDALVGRLVADQDFAAARRLYDRFHPRRAPQPLLQDDDFTDRSAAFPFGWHLIESGTVGAERSLIQGRAALAFRSLQGSDGPVASQLLMLPPGSYRLSTRAAATATDPAAPPYWTITCGGADGKQIAIVDGPAAKDQRTDAVISIPADCPAQWLVLVLRGSNSPDGQAGALAAVRVTPITGSSSGRRSGTGRPA